MRQAPTEAVSTSEPRKKKHLKDNLDGFNQKIVVKVRTNPRLFTIIAVAVLIVIASSSFAVTKSVQKSGPTIINKSTLEKIINASDLSTFEAVYNGIAKVTSPDDAEKVNYYVAYDAEIKAGINFDDVDIRIDRRSKIITIALPEIKITDIAVDIESLDYIFMNDRANTSTVSEEAYRECVADVTRESNSQSAIYELAEQNARNIIEALIDPFVSSLDSEYQIQII